MAQCGTVLSSFIIHHPCYVPSSVVEGHSGRSIVSHPIIMHASHALIFVSSSLVPHIVTLLLSAAVTLVLTEAERRVCWGAVCSRSGPLLSTPRDLCAVLTDIV